MKVPDFNPLPHDVKYPSESMAAALERRRQAVLQDPWRPKKCTIPWPAAARNRFRSLPDNVVRFRK
jgi:hypothetical protein